MTDRHEELRKSVRKQLKEHGIEDEGRVDTHFEAIKSHFYHNPDTDALIKKEDHSKGIRAYCKLFCGKEPNDEKWKQELDESD